MVRDSVDNCVEIRVDFSLSWSALKAGEEFRGNCTQLGHVSGRVRDVQLDTCDWNSMLSAAGVV